MRREERGRGKKTGEISRSNPSNASSINFRPRWNKTSAEALRENGLIKNYPS